MHSLNLELREIRPSLYRREITTASEKKARLSRRRVRGGGGEGGPVLFGRKRRLPEQLTSGSMGVSSRGAIEEEERRNKTFTRLPG